jgi:hypothetical protein
VSTTFQNPTGSGGGDVVDEGFCCCQDCHLMAEITSENFWVVFLDDVKLSLVVRLKISLDGVTVVGHQTEMMDVQVLKNVFRLFVTVSHYSVKQH